MQTLVTGLLIGVALINLAPIVGALSGAQLQRLYGFPFEGDSLLILMRHRAILLGIVGGLLVASAAQRQWLTLAAPAALVSMVSFIGIVWLQGGANAALERILWMDVLGTGMLIAAIVLDRVSRGA